MISKNIKFGKIDNVTVIELGHGDVLVGGIFNTDKKHVGIAFSNDKVEPIGTKCKLKGKTTNETGVDSVLIFKNLESFEVFEHQLANAKNKLIKMLSGDDKKALFEWIPIDEKQPNAQQRVYIACEYSNDDDKVFKFQTMAEYIPYMTVKEEDYISEEYKGYGDYNEEQDEYYASEGFYEWQIESDVNWKVNAKVTHWMPLINLP